MKKFIGILAILMVAINVAGQFEHSVLRDEFTYEMSSTHSVDSIVKMGHAFYSFVANGKAYLITYEEPAGLDLKTMDERRLFVHRLDGNHWVVASNLIQIDYMSLNKEYDACNTYVPLNYYGDKDSLTLGKVTPLENGEFEIKLVCHTYGAKNTESNRSNFYYVILSLKPENNHTFVVTRGKKVNIKF